MHLLEIKINGFKSFADKTSIKLHPESTCIVGPNGSGKSNVADAVRWALGEQSVKSLRGEGSMTDLIFSGSLKRKEASSASVELIFDNKDRFLDLPYNEVSIRRKIYKNGESEYFINNDKVRLKDVTDLFMASGIGKSSYSIISQGEVDKILSGTPQERREVFEDAAGILRYKIRKEEALRKLTRTKDNLKRLRDIIEEIDRQVKPLKKEATKASKYLEFKNELKGQEVSYLVKNISDNKRALDNILFEVNNLSKEEFSLNTDLTSLKAHNEEINTKQMLNKNKLKTLENDLNHKKEALNNILKEKELKALRDTYELDDQKKNNLLLNLQDKKLSLNNEKRSLELSKQRVNEKIKNADTLLRDEINKYNEYHAQSKELYNKLAYYEKEILLHQNKLEFLENNKLSKNRPAYLDALKDKMHLEIFEDIISIDSKYFEAYKAAASYLKYNLITSDKDEALRAINYLKNNNLGRASFMPLKDYENVNIYNAECHDTGFIGYLNDLVKVDYIYQNIIDKELSKYAVFDKAENAARSSLYGKKVLVTIDGDILRKGLITGGKLKNNTLNTQVEIERIKTLLKENKAYQKETSLSLDKLNKDINLLSNNIMTYKSDIELNNNLLLNLDSNIKTIDDKLKSLEYEEEDLSNSDKKYANLVDSEIILRKDITSLEEEILSLNNYLDNLEQEEDQYYLRAKDISSKLLNLKEEVNKQNLAKTKLEFDLDKDLNYLNEEYSLTYEKALLEESKEFDENRIEYLKLELKDLGMVNIDSIKRFEEENDRLTYLSSQEEDLLKAEDMLLDIISEMDEIMIQKFKESFDNISREFTRVFAEMFNGGEAYLKLTSNDLLSAGVEIYANPKGKNLTTINLLSGGEKTLTAISLLFAILNTSPSPFCLFDEVEAALDVENVDKFGKYLKKYQDKTQFLIITHKEKTMEYASFLYGATMEEEGVTKVVSLKLE